MDFQLSDETLALKSLVRRLVDRYQMPLETKLLRSERPTSEEQSAGRRAAQKAGLWGLNLPADHGGMELSTIDNVVVTEENYRCLVPLHFGGRVPEFLLGLRESQKERYLDPVLKGKRRFAFAQTEPDAGSDPGGQMRTHATRVGDNWVINGTKTFISHVDGADFFVVVAVTDLEKRQHGGVTLFLVDRDTPGVSVSRRISMLAGVTTHELVFDGVEVDAEHVIGEPGSGFGTAQGLLSRARLNIGARAVGIAARCVEMMVEHAKHRVAFGEPLARKQAIQAMIVDSWVDVHQTRLVIQHAAWKNDCGEDIRIEAGMVKFLGSEMVGRVVDRAIQIHGAMGASMELPLAHWYDRVRMMRIYEGATEVQRYQVVARELLGA